MKDLEELVPLFDLYRVFYKQESDIKAAREFLKERFSKGECEVLLAQSMNQVVGFTLLYTSFSSVSMKPVFILNDLYVRKEFRGQGIGEDLLNAAKQLCREKQFKGLALETAVDNPAQKLYERLGWEKDSHCFHYFWTAD